MEDKPKWVPGGGRSKYSETDWYKICLKALKGQKVKELAKEYGVSVGAIHSHLRAMPSPLHKDETPQVLRSQGEFDACSRIAHNDLVTFLMNSLEELRESDLPALELLPKFQVMVACAAKLFGWPGPAKNNTLLLNNENSAVNLNLISTSPEKLARAAIARGLLPEFRQDADQNNDGATSDSPAK